MRGRELVGAVAREHEVRVAVDEPGDHAAALGIEARVGVEGPGGADRDHPLILDRHRSVAEQSERAVSDLTVVRDQQTDTVDHQRAHERSAVIASVSSRGTSSVWCRPSRTITWPPTTTWRTSAAVPAKTSASSA